MTVIGQLLYWVFSIYLWVLIARFILDLVLATNPNWRPRKLLMAIAELVFTLTDPPLKFLRRFIKPVRIGMLSLDFSWTVLLILVSIASDFGAGLASNGL